MSAPIQKTMKAIIVSVNSEPVAKNALPIGAA